MRTVVKYGLSTQFNRFERHISNHFAPPHHPYLRRLFILLTHLGSGIFCFAAYGIGFIFLGAEIFQAPLNAFWIRGAWFMFHRYAQVCGSAQPSGTLQEDSVGQIFIFLPPRLSGIDDWRPVGVGLPRTGDRFFSYAVSDCLSILPHIRVSTPRSLSFVFFYVRK